MDRNIYCFWTGHNEMSLNRKRCFNTMVKSNCNITLVNSSNLNQYIKKEYPLHPAYEHLSLTHKSDYLRCYFMHHYGGGYSDIKEITDSWEQAFEDFLDDSCYVNGYQEIGPHGVAPVGGNLYITMQAQYKKLIGCGSFICKAYSPFTTDWIYNLNNQLDNYYDSLKKYPSTHPQEKPGMIINGTQSKYPIAWTSIMGNIFHPLCLKYANNIKQTVPPCIFNSYR